MTGGSLLFKIIIRTACICGLLWIAPNAWAQGQAIDGIIEGFVKSENAAPAAGAMVRAVNQGTGFSREATTDTAGRYSLPLLPPGTYVITAESNGLPKATRSNVELRAGQVLTVEFELRAANIAETIQVTAQIPLVETGRTVSSNTYDERTVRSIPTVGRSLLDFFVLQPGVNARPLSTGGSGTGTPTTVYGGLGLRQMNVDGVSTITSQNATALGIPQSSIGAINQTFRAHTLTARADAQLNADNRLFARYNYYFDRESPLGSGLQSLETLARFDEDPHSATAQLVTTISPRILNEARFLFATRGISNGVPNPDAPNINISGVGSFNGNSNGTRVTREQGFQIIDNLSINLGRHFIKTGFDLLPVKFRERTTNINGTFTFGGLAAVANVRGAISPLDQFLLTERGAIDPARHSRMISPASASSSRPPIRRISRSIVAAAISICAIDSP
jgi:hypothetical protein